MKYLILFSVLLFGALPSQAQNVKVNIHNPIAKDGTEIWFCRSIDGDPAHYVVMYDKVIFKGGKASKSFSVDTTMFIMLANNPYLPKTRFVISKGDVINVNVDQDTILHTQKIAFAGNNASGHEEYYNSPLYLGTKLNIKVKEVITGCTDFKEAVEKLEQLKKNLFSPMDSLYSTHKITKSYYEYVRLEGDAEFSYSVYSITDGNKYNTNKFQLVESELSGIKQMFLSKYDAFSAPYRNINYRNNIARQRGSAIADGTIKGNYPLYNLKLWDKKQVSNNYIPVAIQEGMFATDLIYKQKFGMISQEEAEKDAERFKRVFPNSVFLPVIQSTFPEKSKVSPYTFGKYSSETNIFNTIKNDSLVSFPDFITKNFPGKYVMVDLWATWCSPCKQEFAFSKDVAAFLKKNKVELLYFSVDNRENGDNWLKDIQKYKLSGYHYLATDIVSKYLEKYIGNLSVPRYLLFDDKGNMIDNGLPNPSEKEEKLFKVIASKLPH